MSNLQVFRKDTEVGSLEFIGIAVSNDFDYRKFALDNGFLYTSLDSVHNTNKYGGVGFFVAKNFLESSESPYHLKKRLEVLFVDSKPVMYKIN